MHLGPDIDITEKWQLECHNEVADTELQSIHTIPCFYRDWKSPLEKILEYIKTVDGEYHAILSQKLGFYMELLSNKAKSNYTEKLSCSQKDELARILHEAVENFNHNEEAYVCNSSDKECQ